MRFKNVGVWAVVVAMSILFACGETIEVKEAEGNAELVWDTGQVSKPVDGAKATVNQVRVWRSRGNQESPGVVTVIDQYVLEVFMTLDGETGQRHLVSSGLNLRADNDGNLYMASTPPGSVAADTEGVAGNRLVGEPRSYTRVAEDGLLLAAFTPRLAWTEVTSTENNSKVTTVNELIDMTQVGGSPYGDLRRVQAPLFVQRKRNEINKDNATKAKLGCLVNAADASGNRAAKTFVWADVELGSVVVDKSGVETVSNPGTDTRGDDDAILMQWTENWLIAGANIRTRTLRVKYEGTVPFYNRRELPGVDTTDTEPKPSGIEGLIRSCNAAAAAAGGRFALVAPSHGTVADDGVMHPKFAATANAFCLSLKTAVDANAKTVALTSATYDGCAFSLPVGGGTWDGSAHTGPVVSAASTLEHVGQTGFATVTF